MDDAISRLREKAQNEATCFALNDECKHLRQQLAALKSDYCNIDSAADAQAAELYKVKQQLAECKSKWEHFENSVAEKSMQCLSLEKELAECQKDGKHYAHEYLIAKDALAECQRERDELKTWLEDQVCEAKDFAYKLEGKTVELATVIKERDELVAALKKLLSGCDTGERNPDGTQRGRSMPEKWQVDQAHAALAKLGADKAGEV